MEHDLAQPGIPKSPQKRHLDDLASLARGFAYKCAKNVSSNATTKLGKYQCLAPCLDTGSTRQGVPVSPLALRWQHTRAASQSAKEPYVFVIFV